MLACYVLTLSGLYVRCLASAIHEMTTINKTTAKLDHVPFTCNWFMKLRKWAHRCMLLQKIFSKISANFSNCDGVYFQKRIISETGECLLKKNSATIFFLHCDINQFKTLKISSPFIDQERFLIFRFSIHWSGEIFPFPLTFPNEGCSCAA